jgi:hypothetical protein
MPVATRDRVQTLSRGIAAFSLPGTVPAEPVRIADEEWQGLLIDLVAQRLTGLALAAVEVEAMQLSPTHLSSLADRHRAAMIHALRLERLLLVLADAFRAAGLEMVVLKGPAMAHDRYADPAWRPFGDLDILVRTRDWGRVGTLLARCGFSSRSPEPRPGFRERFGHTWVHTHQSGLELDLHRTLVAGPFGLWMDADELFDHTSSFTLAGKELRRLDDQAIFLHACVHAALGHRPPLLLPLRDVVESAPPDWSQAGELADRWRLRAVVSHALISASTTLTTELPPDASDLMEVAGTFPKRERRALEAYTTERRGRGGKALASLWAIRGLDAKAAYLRALLFPDREFLAFREGGRGAVALRARWAKPLKWLARH